MPEAFGLYLVMTDPLRGYERCAEAAVETGLRYVQLRMKREPDEDVLAMARRIREITRDSSTRFIVNDSVDIAAAADADGVHLGQDDMPLAEARRQWPTPGKIFGLSTHGEQQESDARAAQPDYIGVGPVFATPTKDKPDPTLGLERMGRIIRDSPLTAVAIGGIHAENLADVLGHGAVNYCVVRAVNRRDDTAAAIAELQAIWREHVAPGDA